MSLFDTETIYCPKCNTGIEVGAVASVNAERRPDLRADILDDRFQSYVCENCQTRFRLDPLMTYFDIARDQWILVQPIQGLANWPALEQQARETFDKAFGETAPRPARAIGASMSVRVTFGWAALREKLLCMDHLLDDVVLEALKCGILRTLPDPPLSDTTELRLLRVGDGQLRFGWVDTVNNGTTEGIDVPMEAYEAIEGDDWQPLLDLLSEGPFVDMHRIMVPVD
jgi:CpXC protein